MDHKRRIGMGMTALLAAGSAWLTACGSAPATASSVASAATLPATAVSVGAPASPAGDAAAGAEEGVLTEAEIKGLYWMREEEKLARDVYLAMFDLWGQTTFERIAASESRHMEAVLSLIEAYGLEDPVVVDTPGVFSDPELAALYTSLVEQGSGSPADALTVGATIEDLDILDLEEQLVVTDQADIRRVYENLLRGSINHLRAFTGRLQAEGADYVPAYHTEDEIAALLADAGSPGRQRRGR